MADLVWSDPDPDRDEFSLSPRGAGYTFGAQVVKKFLEVNNMSHILRAHQLCQEGYQVLYDDRLSTVWSAPNYCYRCGNVAAIMELGEDGSGDGIIARSNGDYGRSDGVGPGPMMDKNITPRGGPARRYRVFQAAPQDSRGMPAKKPVADYFL